jgi:hypothetical protein
MKIRVVLLIAVAAAFAVTVAPAMAFKEFVIKASKYPAGTGSETSKQVFKTSSGSLECSKSITVSGSEHEKELAMTVEAFDEECTAFGFAKAVVSTIESEYLPGGLVNIIKETTIKAALCLVLIPIQKGLGLLTYEDLKPEKGINIKGILKGITYISKGCLTTEKNTNGEASVEAVQTPRTDCILETLTQLTYLSESTGTRTQCTGTSPGFYRKAPAANAVSVN